MIELTGLVFAAPSQKVLFTLEAKKLPYKFTRIDRETLMAKPKDFMDKSPFGVVPVVNDNGEVLFESNAICEYLDETYKDTPLIYGSNVEKARIRGLALNMDFLLINIVNILGRAVDKEDLNKKLSLLKKKLGFLENYIGEGSYLYKDKCSLADVYFAPLIVRNQLFKKNTGLNLFEGFTKVEKIEKNIMNADWFNKIYSDKDLFPQYEAYLADTLSNISNLVK